MSLTSQVNLVCKSSHFHIRDIRRIRNLIPLSIAITLANSLVSSRLDYCSIIFWHEQAEHSETPACTKFSCAGHHTNFKVSAHHSSSQRSPLAPITQRIEYKISLLTFKTIMNGQPSYLHQYLIPQTHYSSTRLSQTSALFIPRTRTSTGKRAFSVAAPRIWNSLPAAVRTTTSVSSFRSKLKTHFFKIAFPP